MGQVKNLKQLREEIEKELQHAPDLLAHREDVAAVVNRLYVELAAMFEWPWLYRAYTLRVHPSVAQSWSFGAASEPGSFKLTKDESDFNDQFDLNGGGNSSDVIHLLLGAEVTFSTAGVGDNTLKAYDEPFIIEKVERAAPDDIGLWLDPRFTNGASAGTVTIVQKRYQLPPDFDRMVHIMSRDDDRGEVGHISRDRERSLMLNDETGPVAVYLMESSFPIFSADGGSAIFNPTYSNEQSPGVVGDWIYQRRNQAPRKVFTAASSNGAGGLAAGVKYTYACAWFYAGRHSPLGPEVEITVGAGEDTVDLSSLPILASEWGRELHIFRRKAEGPWYWVGTPLDGSTNDPNPTIATFTDLNDDEVLERSPHQVRRWDEIGRDGGQYEYIRFYPQTDTAKDLEVTYLKRPRLLIDDYDVPEFDGAFHAYLVWAAVADLAARGDGEGLSALATNRANRVLRNMKRRYGIEGTRHQKGMIGQTPQGVGVITLPLNYTGP